MFLRMPLKCSGSFFVNSEDISHAEMNLRLNPMMSSG